MLWNIFSFLSVCVYSEESRLFLRNMSNKARKYMYIKRSLERDAKRMKISGSDEFLGDYCPSSTQSDSTIKIDPVKFSSDSSPVTTNVGTPVGPDDSGSSSIYSDESWEEENSKFEILNDLVVPMNFCADRNASSSPATINDDLKNWALSSPATSNEGTPDRPDDSGSSSIYWDESREEEKSTFEILNDLVVPVNFCGDQNASSSQASLNDALKNWALSLNVNHIQLNGLLNILKPYHDELPLDSRTLLGTSRALNISSMCSQNDTEGQYIYFGIKKSLEDHLLYGNLSYILSDKNMTSIDLKCNVDGLKIHKSTNIDFWPILAAVHIEDLKTIPFVVAIYMGDSKPKCLESYLQDFIEEINLLSRTGLKYGDKNYSFSLKYMLCDAPARAFLKKVKCHNGYYACERCNVKGEKINGRFIYKVTGTEEKRTHETFTSQRHKGHHLGLSPFLKVENFDIVYGFPMDYMHMACLGIMRRLLNLWFKSDSNYRISATFRRKASAQMVEIALWVPKEFGRRPRAFSELDRWKATEFRFFLLYIGVFVLKDILPNDKYKHFVKFVCAMRIICSRSFSQSLGDAAVECIETFCTKFEDVYDGEIEPIFNTHSIYHLVQDSVQKNENPEDINCFLFENYLGQLKKMIRTPNKPLSQVCKRLDEQKGTRNMMIEYNNETSVLYEKCGVIVKALKLRNMYISKLQRDSFVLLTCGKVMSVNKITIDDNIGIKVHGPIYQCTENIFSFSKLSSSALFMYRIKNLSQYNFTIFIEDILTKCVVFPLSDHLGAVGLLHINY